MEWERLEMPQRKTGRVECGERSKQVGSKHEPGGTRLSSHGIMAGGRFIQERCGLWVREAHGSDDGSLECRMP